MNKPDYSILDCNSFRLGGEPQGTCNEKEAPEIQEVPPRAAQRCWRGVYLPVVPKTDKE